MLFYGLVSHESVYIESVRYSDRRLCNPAVKDRSCRQVKLKPAYINGEEILVDQAVKIQSKRKYIATIRGINSIFTTRTLIEASPK